MAAAAGIAFPPFTPSTRTMAFFKPPLLLTINCCDSRTPLPHTFRSLFTGRAGNFGIEPEIVIVPFIAPLSDGGGVVETGFSDCVCPQPLNRASEIPQVSSLDIVVMDVRQYQKLFAPQILTW